MTYTEALLLALAWLAFAGFVGGLFTLLYLALSDLSEAMGLKKRDILMALGITWIVPASLYGIPYLLMEGKL